MSLALVVLVKIISPPTLAGAFTGATAGDALQSKLAQSFSSWMAARTAVASRR